jgi:hypothetical protein
MLLDFNQLVDVGSRGFNLRRVLSDGDGLGEIADLEFEIERESLAGGEHYASLDCAFESGMLRGHGVGTGGSFRDRVDTRFVGERGEFDAGRGVDRAHSRAGDGGARRVSEAVCRHTRKMWTYRL